MSQDKVVRGTDGWSIQALEELRIILIRQACQIMWDGRPLFAQQDRVQSCKS